VTRGGGRPPAGGDGGAARGKGRRRAVRAARGCPPGRGGAAQGGAPGSETTLDRLLREFDESRQRFLARRREAREEVERLLPGLIARGAREDAARLAFELAEMEQEFESKDRVLTMAVELMALDKVCESLSTGAHLRTWSRPVASMPGESRGGRSASPRSGGRSRRRATRSTSGTR
jgi:hypothetical protein